MRVSARPKTSPEPSLPAAVWVRRTFPLKLSMPTVTDHAGHSHEFEVFAQRPHPSDHDPEHAHQPSHQVNPIGRSPPPAAEVQNDPRSRDGQADVHEHL